MKKKVSKVKLMGAYGAIFLMVCAFIGISYGVSAYTNASDSQPVIINEAGGIINYNEAPTAPIMDEVTYSASEEMLGASSVNSSVQPMEDNNGDVVYHLNQNLIHSTTTIFSIPDPFLTVTSTAGGGVVVMTNGATPPLQWTGATSTVDFARIYITGVATTSYKIYCGAAANPTATPTIWFMESGEFATSSKGIVESDLIAIGGADITGSSTPHKILLTPTLPYFTCIAVQSNAVLGHAIFQATATLEGKLYIRVSRSRF
jgi:hypothetical protein